MSPLPEPNVFVLQVMSALRHDKLVTALGLVGVCRSLRDLSDLSLTLGEEPARQARSGQCSVHQIDQIVRLMNAIDQASDRLVRRRTAMEAIA